MAQQDKRMRKLTGLKGEALRPELYPPQGGSHPETLLVTWGSTYGPCREAVDRILADDRAASVSMLHFAQVHPINVEATREALCASKRIISVEGNQTGQFAGILQEAHLAGEIELLTRYDGLPFTAEYIIGRVMG
jgi:2-oxoglutarate ferredoxin oxidoreductase subunit alpha